MTHRTTASRHALGCRVRNLRDVRGWSQKDLATRADLDLAEIIEIEQGARDPDLAGLEAIAACLAVAVGEIVCETKSL